MDSNFIGFIGIAIGIFLGFIGIALAIFFGLSGFRKSIVGELSTIKETVIAIRTTAEKTWDLALRQFAPGGGTVERELEKLGNVRITAEPSKNETVYLIEIERPILKEGFFYKKAQEPQFTRVETELLGKEGTFSILSPKRLRYHLPSTNPKTCTEFVTFLLNWLNSTYIESLEEIKEFEEPILT